MKVAIVDGGLEINHGDLSPKYRTYSSFSPTELANSNYTKNFAGTSAFTPMYQVQLR